MMTLTVYQSNTTFHSTKKRMLMLLMLLILLHKPIAGLSSTDPSVPINEAAMKLVEFCIDPEVGLDEHAITVLVDHVLSPKQTREYALPKLLDSNGAYVEFDTKTTFPRFIEYSYNPLIPPVITRPSSLRYAIWSTPRSETQKLPASWEQVPPGGAPIVIQGMQKESDTPNLDTGVYHEYNLKRTLILVNYKGRQVLISISKQTDTSSVGKKGIILGKDEDWNYYYSGEPGTMTTGLGWAKSYIYDFVSIGVYLETGTASSTVRSGVFQWLRAGWLGINFVKSTHILNGMRRFARDFRITLESARLPAPLQIISVYQGLSNIPPDDLIGKYAALQQALRSLAMRSGKISKSGGEKQGSFVNTPKEQMLQELMLQYLKGALGKPTVLEKQSFLQRPFNNWKYRAARSIRNSCKVRNLWLWNNLG